MNIKIFKLIFVIYFNCKLITEIKPYYYNKLKIFKK